MNINKFDRTCILCHSRSVNPSFDMPGIVFNFLDKIPFICEMCIFKALTKGMIATDSTDWINTIKKKITKET